MLITSLLGLIIIFTANIVFGIRYGFGFRHYWFFELLHFLGGFFGAMFLVNFVSSYVLIFAGLIIVTILWESAEYVIYKFPIIFKYMKRRFPLLKRSYEWKDTALDVFLNFSGATLFIYLIA